MVTGGDDQACNEALSPNAITITDLTLKAKVLDHYQGIIARLAGDSSSLKGWAVSIAMALIGFAAKDGPLALALLALVPILILWLLDSYYLAAERIYRDRFNAIAIAASPKTDIGGAGITFRHLLGAMFTWVNLGVYATLAVVALVIGFGVIALPKING